MTIAFAVTMAALFVMIFGGAAVIGVVMAPPKTSTDWIVFAGIFGGTALLAATNVLPWIIASREYYLARRRRGTR